MRSTFAAVALLAACGSSARPSEPRPSVTVVDGERASSDGGLESSQGLEGGGGEPEAGARDAGAARVELEGTCPAGMLPVPGGTFTMGRDVGGEPDERPAHSVTLRPFCLDRTEVSHAQYRECVRAGRCAPPDLAILARLVGFGRDNQPVSAVSWNDARAYCTFMLRRLPTEAEFERAVRGDDGRKFPWGDAPPSDTLTVALGRGFPDDVASKPAGKGPYGHDDLAGNVWEWVDDEYDPYAYVRPRASEGKPGSCDDILRTLAELRQDKKQGFTGSNPIPTTCERVLRGGAYNYHAEGLRSTNRVHHPGTYRLAMSGFRCAK